LLDGAPAGATVATANLVLVVDDDPSTRKAMARLLRLRGFDAELFESGEAFLAQADWRAALCAVFDIQLPGITGIELRQRLAGVQAPLPIIFMTANDSDAMRRSAEEAGCVAYLSKPFTLQTLASAIDAAVASRHAG
jgi:FixJ family two-component response regulator